MPSTPPETRASLILRLPDAADMAAWEEFVAIYGPLVFRLARRQGLQSADADDVVQEVLTAVARHVSQWLNRKDRGSFRAWLFRIARNVAINFLTRRATRSLGVGGDEAERFVEKIPAAASSISSQFDLEYRREAFRWAANQVRQVVSEDTWQAFWLTHVEERPIRQVAEQLRMPVGNIYISRSRVMARLRALVIQHEDSP